uniref:Response regulator n=1 Tax=Desulfobacca acetoxidans TaxID=60893 RepID=A0A7V4LC56_9BACT
MTRPKLQVVVVTGERGQAPELLGILSSLTYTGVTVPSLAELEDCLPLSPHVAVILDLDTVRPTPSTLRGLKKRYPSLHFMGISSQAYHPGMEEVIGSHLYACLVRPVDAEELGFWLKTIAENLAEAEFSRESEERV